MTVAQNETELVAQLNQLSPEQLFVWAKKEHGQRAGIITSFQDTGCVMIDLMSRVAPGMRVITVDTLRLHDETYALMREVEQRYGIQIERFTPDPEALQQMITEHGEYLFFDSRAKQELCCQIRKVEPNARALETLDVWFTGLRRDQSEFRSSTPKVQWVFRNGRRILKIAPLVDWSQERVDAYITEHNVPKNALYEKGYTSIGCIICTTPTLSHEEKRAGRWRWQNMTGEKVKECGIHMDGSGI